MGISLILGKGLDIFFFLIFSTNFLNSKDERSIVARPVFITTFFSEDLLSVFKKNKIEKINTLKKKFDPNFHQAITEIEDNKVEPGTIVQEIQAGYMFGERLLRPSLVSVSKKSDQKIKQNKEKDEKKS